MAVYVSRRLTAPTLQAERYNASWFPARRVVTESMDAIRLVYHWRNSDGFTEVIG